MGYNSYDVSYSFYTNRETGYKYFSGGSICFGTNPRWGMDSNNTYNVLEVKLYKKRWGPDEYMGTRVYQKMLATKHIDGLAFDQVNISYI